MRSTTALALLTTLLVSASCGDTGKKDNSGPPEQPADQDQQDRRPPPTPPQKTPAPEPQPDPDPFPVKVEPTLTSVQSDLIDTFCVSCHQGDNPPRNLDLTNLSKFMNGERGIGGYTGQLIKPGKASESMLFMIINTSNPDQKMPPPESSIPQLNSQQLEAVRSWIDSLPVQDGSNDEPGGDDEPF